MLQRTRRVAGTLAALAVCLLLLGADATSPPARSTEPVAGGAGKRVLIVPIHGEINRIQGAFLHRSLRHADQYDAVIFDIDTPGGRGDIMSEMSNEITDLKVRTIAFVPNHALSAGAFIAMSCNPIYMKSRSLIGAARGYLPGPDGLPVELPKSIEEKLASANRAQFRALAEAKGYPPALAEAMTDETLEVKEVIYEGKKQYLTSDQIADIEADPLKKENLHIKKTVSPKDRLLTLTGKDALEYGIAKGIVADRDEVLKREGLAGADKVEVAQNWSDKLIAILTSREVVGLLILIGFGGVWLELKMPGFGAPGTIAVVSFLLVFASQFLVGHAHALEIILFVVGIALLFIELFVTPGFGVIGSLGIVLLVVSLVLAMQPFVIPEYPWQFHQLRMNLLAVLSGMAGSVVILLLAIWFLPGTSIFQRIALQKELKTAEGFGGGVDEGGSLVGQAGTVVSPLRPAGKMEISDKIYSVVSDGEFIGQGGRARVILVDGARIVVVPLAPEKPKEPEFRA